MDNNMANITADLAKRGLTPQVTVLKSMANTGRKRKSTWGVRPSCNHAGVRANTATNGTEVGRGTMQS